jgi:hypothetical protein
MDPNTIAGLLSPHNLQLFFVMLPNLAFFALGVGGLFLGVFRVLRLKRLVGKGEHEKFIEFVDKGRMRWFVISALAFGLLLINVTNTYDMAPNWRVDGEVRPYIVEWYWLFKLVGFLGMTVFTALSLRWLYLEPFSRRFRKRQYAARKIEERNQAALRLQALNKATADAAQAAQNRVDAKRAKVDAKQRAKEDLAADKQHGRDAVAAQKELGKQNRPSRFSIRRGKGGDESEEKITSGPPPMHGARPMPSGPPPGMPSGDPAAAERLRQRLMGQGVSPEG